MLKGKSFLAVIPARGGSKGLPRKNLLPLGGKPMIAWSIAEAKLSKYIDRVIVSSEDAEIIETSRQHGADVPFVRPAELAQDHSSGMDSVLHALDEIPGYDYVVLLQPTSPLRTHEDIDNCLEAMMRADAPAAVSLTIPDKSPFWMFSMDDDKKLTPLIAEDLRRRQELPIAYLLNGAIYVAKTEWLKENATFVSKETVGYLMPKQRSIDVDTKIDMAICEMLIQERNQTNVQGSANRSHDFQRA